GLGLAQLGRHRDRCRAPRKACAEQRRRRSARRSELLPDEVASQAGAGRRGLRGDRELHPRERAADDGGQAEPRRSLSHRPRRRALLDGLDAEVVVVGPAVPISRRSRIGVPVGARANLSLALALGRFDVVHGFEPGLPSLSYLALRDAQALAVATFLSPERLGYPPGRAQRDRLLARLDALLATSEETAAAAATRFPGHYRVVPEGVDVDAFAPTEKRRQIVLEWKPTERPLARAIFRALHELPDWELVLLRTKPLA